MSAEHAEHVVIQGDVFLYKDKAPFVGSGVSVAGALEYDHVEDKIKCHECGEWVRHLGVHLKRAEHNLTAREYKLKHGLKQTTALVSEKIRRRLVVNGLRRASSIHVARLRLPKSVWLRAMKKSMKTRRLYAARGVTTERTNGFMACHSQLLGRLQELALRLGRKSLRMQDCQRAGLHYATLIRRFGSVERAFELAGLNRVENVRGGGRILYSTEYLEQCLRCFAQRYKRVPSLSDFRRGLVGPSTTPFERCFGTIGKAQEVARAAL